MNGQADEFVAQNGTADQPRIDQPISDGPLTPVWQGDLLGGIVALRGTWADGSPLLAIPNYARLNRLGTNASARAVGGDASVNYAGNTSTNAAPVAAGAFGRGGRGGEVRSEVWMKAEH